VRVAALDFGTNTCLLLIADVSASGKIEKIIHDEAQVVRLGQGVAKNKKLHPEALQRAEHTFREFARTINSSKVDKTLACATSAARDVSNAQELIDLALKYKIPVKVISGEEEAELTFQGTIEDDLQTPVAIIDVGGGSTEYILGDANGIQVRTSIDIGSVRLTEKFITEHPVPQDQLEKLKAYIAEQLQGLKEKINVPPGTRIIAVAGTPTTLAAMDQGFAFDSKRVQGHQFPNDRLKYWLDRLADMGVQERRAITGMDAKRADVIVAGAMILLMSAEALGAEKLEVSVKGLRYGVAKMMATQTT
jgi:exopolyphosphatase/guanosine-5'-triphosphate,3'-diphosphate pyrophosphatase